MISQIIPISPIRPISQIRPIQQFSNISSFPILTTGSNNYITYLHFSAPFVVRIKYQKFIIRNSYFIIQNSLSTATRGNPNQVALIVHMTKKILFFLSFILLLLIFLGIPVRVKAAPYGNFLELSGGHIKTMHLNQSSPAGFSFESWIKPNTVSGIQTIVSIGNQDSDKSSYELAVNGGSLTFLVRFGGGSMNVLGGGIRQIEPNVWNHVAATIDGSSMEIFINGQRANFMGGISSLSVISDTISLGDNLAESSFSSNNFSGAIDEVRISSVKRDVVTLWNSEVYYSGLNADSNTVVLYHLDESRGETTAKDASVNKLDGTLIGADSQIHFYGVLPTPTPFPASTPWFFTLPTIRWTRPVLPTLSIPWNTQPTQTPPDNTILPTPISSRPVSPRTTRPSFRTF